MVRIASTLTRFASTPTLSLAVVFCTAGVLSAQGMGGGGASSSGPGGAFNSSGGAFGGSGGAGGLGGGGSILLNASAMAGGFMQFGLGVTNGFGNSGNAQPSTFGARAISNPAGSTGTQGGANRQGSSTGNRGGGGGNTGRGGTGGRGGTAARTAGAAGRNRGSSAAAPAEPQYWYEPRVQIGFEIAPPQTTAVSARVETSLGIANEMSQFRNVQVYVNGGTAYLRGSVSSIGDRQLAEQVALLEPSISSVQNELSVRMPFIAPRPPAAQP